MRTILLAGCVVCLAVFAAPALANADTAEVAIAPEAAVGETAPTPVPAEAAPAAATQPTACAIDLQEPGSGFPSCGSACTPPPFWNRAECVGYDCRGILTIGMCSCEDGRWACSWQDLCP